MFKFLSIFKKNKDEQLNDKKYDFDEMLAPVIDIEGEVAQKPLRIDNTFGGKQNVDPKVTALAKAGQKQKDQVIIDALEDELRNMSDDTHLSSGRVIDTDEGGTTIAAYFPTDIRERFTQEPISTICYLR